MKHGILTLKEVTDKTTLPRAAIYRLLEEKAFPAPFQMDNKRIAWAEADIDAWILSRPRDYDYPNCVHNDDVDADTDTKH